MSTAPPPRKFVIGSRGSQLARAQTHIVLGLLRAQPGATPEFVTSFMTTTGDRDASQAVYLLGGKDAWTKDLEVALLEGAIDMIVHACKDVPTTLPQGCVIGAVLQREDPVDSLVVKAGKEWKTLEDLPPGSVVGTSSVRRVAQLRRKFPDLKFLDVRGNLDTRVAKLDAPDGPYDALILAKAGMLRVNMGHRLTCDVGPPTLFPAVAQGAIAVEIRDSDPAARRLCEQITDRHTQWAVYAERACLRVLEGGCSVPVGVYTQLDLEKGELELTGCVTALDGLRHVQRSFKGPVATLEDAQRVGESLAHLLMENGAGEILDEIKGDRAKIVAS